MKSKRSAILAAVHQTASGLYEAAAMDSATLREFDRLCTKSVDPMEIEQPTSSDRAGEAGRIRAAASREPT
jgi:putative transcriptional regulator